MMCRVKEKRAAVRLLMGMFIALLIFIAPAFRENRTGTGTVVAEAAEQPKLSKKSVTINLGDTYNLYILNTPGSYTVSYWTTNDWMLDVDSDKADDRSRYFKLTPKNPGTVSVYIRLFTRNYTKEFVCKVNVVKRKALSDSSKTIKKGSAFTIKMNNAGTSSVKWSVSDKKILKLTRLSNNKYKVTGLRNGTAYVYAKTGKKTYKCRVSIKGSLAKYKYEVSLLAPQKVYENCASVLYIKTNNPDPDSFDIGGVDSFSIVSFDDVHYLKKDTTSKLRRVKGGYIFVTDWDTSGKKTICIKEYLNHSQVITGTLKINVDDYDDAEQKWINKVISSVTDSSMSDKEKMDRLCSYVQNDFEYYSNDGVYMTTLTSDLGAYWDSRKIDCLGATAIMMKFARKLGLKCEATYAGYLNHYYATVWIDGKDYVYDASPFSESGVVKNWEYII